MSKTRPAVNQELLFDVTADSPYDSITPLSTSESASDAVQNHRAGTVAAVSDTPRATETTPPSAGDSGTSGSRTADQPTTLDGNVLSTAAANGSRISGERELGTGDSGFTGSFVSRLFPGGRTNSHARPTDRRSPTTARRLKKHSQPANLFEWTPTPEADEVVAKPNLPASKPTPAAVLWPPLDVPIAKGEKAKARDLIAAIQTLQQLESEQRPANAEKLLTLSKFVGFGAVALHLFPNPVTGQYRDAGWQELGEQLQGLLTPQEYDSVKRTTFSAFYTSPLVMQGMHQALTRLGVPSHGLLLEPGCGIGNFLKYRQPQQRCLGVEMDAISGRIAKQLYPDQQIRIENFRDTHLPENQIDAVIGNVPFSGMKLDYQGSSWALHDFFFAKSLDALKPGGVMALVTSHYTLDKQNGAIRDYLAEKADFVGAIRLPSSAFKQEGTAVVTDIVFLRKRSPRQSPQHVDPAWLKTAPLELDDRTVQINKYFMNHPEQVLGTYSTEDTLYAKTGYSLKPNGDLATQLSEAIDRLPRVEPVVNQSTSLFAEPVAPLPTLPTQQSAGSFYVGPDRVIYQWLDGTGEPVVYGGKTLTAYGTLVAKRLTHLLKLRDQARVVLASQNESWPEEQRQQARQALNRTYDSFVNLYGPINKTTLSETTDGTTIRRMPNLVKFREDPDAMLVMSLEDYDEVTGKATKAAIMERDVVGRTAIIERVDSAAAGLLVVLNERGKVDLPRIAELYRHSEIEVIQELGDLIYLNPVSHIWETADVYLSGNVREKLVQAQAAGPEFARNAQALAQVQPEDVLPGEIDANLGSPWIPQTDIEQFANHLFQVDPGSIQIRYLPKEAQWQVTGNHLATASVAANADYGTQRINGLTLLEQALNMKSPTIYDTIDDGGREQRVVNPEATLAARDKQRQIKDKFRDWVFHDPERTERLVRIYNDTYNNLRPRLFDGSHLNFPGMNQALSLRPHQQAAVWRGMTSGNTLLAHTVGAGKTFTMAATGMKMKQAGLIHKPMYVVPNHLLEQFAREFMQLYPNAKLLVASKDDLARDRRKLLTAKIASGEWDGIIVTHSSFERIGMSRQYQEKFLREQIQEYTDLLIEHAANQNSNRNLIKTLEKQKAHREEKLKNLLAEDKKDDGLVFDELGVDQLFVDEAHAFKNLETPTKMDRVAGIQTSGSEKAFDLYMKSQYLHQRHPGHGVVFATGTPISNTMVELYTMQRFLDPTGLAQRGLGHFDAWAATFGEVVETMELAPDGAGLRPRSRFAKFTNLPELQQMFRSFADVQTAEMLSLPRPTLKAGKPAIVACPMSAEQQALQLELIERYERLRSEKVDPREDNALAITTDGRKLATDARMLTPDATDHSDSKINRLVENVVEIWKESAATRGTQLIFSDFGVHPTAWGYSPYQEIVEKLKQHGIPADQIATIGEAESDAKKQALFEKVRNGSIRVLLGSTQKMGTGTNVQKRLIALHHLDAPWKPAEVEQRDGRIMRQGNQNPEVTIYRYVTEGSFDAYMWQALETKARFISQVMTGQNVNRRAEDVGGQELSYAEVKAIASGNPAVLTLAEMEAELQRWHVLQKNHADEQFLTRKRVKELPNQIAFLEREIHALKADRQTIVEHEDQCFEFAGRVYGKHEGFEVLAKKLEQLPGYVMQQTKVPLGKFNGLEFGVVLDSHYPPVVYVQGECLRRDTLSRDHQGPRAVMNALERLRNSYRVEMQTAEQELLLKQRQFQDYDARLGQSFAAARYVQQLTALRDQLKAKLSKKESGDADPAEKPTHELIEAYQAMKAGQQAEIIPLRPKSAEKTLELPIASRVRELVQNAPAEVQEYARAV
jgi:N12 class adenine-specific DNA methylase